MTTRTAFVLGLLLGVAPVVASAQTIRGRAVPPSDSVGIPGVVVMLLDSAGFVHARALTNERGEYRLAAALPGRYRLRTLRIGYHPTTSDAIELRTGEDLERRLDLTSNAITLDTLRVAARARCDRFAAAAGVVPVWEQARGALTAAQLTARDRLLHARVTRTRRAHDPRTREVRSERALESAGFVTKAWGTLPADSLRRFGYVYKGADSSMTYHAPDVDALLSDDFLQDHCFRLASGPDATLLGVAFEPTNDRRDIPEIAGTVWLDRKSAELRSMDFRYVNLRGPRAQAASGPNAAGGGMQFVRMANAGWAISSWEIRIPLLQPLARAGAATPYEQTSMTSYAVRELVVESGLLTLVTRGADTLWRKPQ